MDSNSQGRQHHIAVVIPCYRVKRQILEVIRGVPEECEAIYVIDDNCPEGSGAYVSEECHDERVRVIYHSENQGVGAAVVTGYRQAQADGMTIIVKIDGDGQMEPRLLMRFAGPILRGDADYVKGNRFHGVDGIRRMPLARMLGNAALSFMSKLSTGYWNIFDPTNGYTAIHTRIIDEIPLHKVDRRFFFETDLLFRLNLARAKVIDVPMAAVYGEEKSNLSLPWSVAEFLVKHAVNLCKRIIYSYFLLDFSLASIQLLGGLFLLLFGVSFGLAKWYSLARVGVAATAGTVMLAGMPVIVGTELILAFLAYDISSVPEIAVHSLLEPKDLA
jgi:dolichol-phosphate mannosyltransferase